jgi:hypothetical protein
MTSLQDLLDALVPSLCDHPGMNCPSHAEPGSTRCLIHQKGGEN